MAKPIRRYEGNPDVKYHTAERYLAIERRWSSSSKISLAFQQYFKYHAAEPQHTLSGRSAAERCLDRGGGGLLVLPPPALEDACRVALLTVRLWRGFWCSHGHLKQSEGFDGTTDDDIGRMTVSQ